MMGGIGQMVFGMVFNFMLMMLFAPKPKDTINYGPRLDNLKPAIKDIQGQIINLTYGTTRISGTVFWCSDIRETVHEDVTEHSSKGGSSYTNTEVSYTYDCDIAVGICEGPIVGIRKIWANKELIYNTDTQPNYVSWLKWRLYTGTEDQGLDPILEANFGSPITTAHRGLAYIVFEQFQLDPFGRRVPQSIEFEVVAKGTAGGVAYKYPQVEYDDWSDYGDSELIPVSNVLLMLDYNTIIFPILNYGANNSFGDSGIPVRWGKLNVAESSITKYSIPSGLTWDGNGIGYGTWVSGLSIGGWHRHLGGYAWFPLNWGQGYKNTPCFIQCCSYDVSQNDYGYWQVFNLINGRMVGHGYISGGYVGSFTDFFYGGIALGSIFTVQVNYSSETLYEHDITNITKKGIDTNVSNYDEYGFSKNILNIGMGNNKEKLYPVNRSYVEDVKSNYIFYFIGFPPEYEVITPDYVLGEEQVNSIIYERTYDINTVYGFGYYKRDLIMYENCTHNIMDSLERGLCNKIKINITTKKTTIYEYKPPTIENTSTTYVYLAELGPVVEFYDNDPDPPNPNPPYEKNIDLYTRRSLFVHNVTNPIETNTYDPTFWIRFSNGSELACMNGKIYTKPTFVEYDYPNTYEEWVEAYGISNEDTSFLAWNLYSSINLSVSLRKTIPNNHFPDYDRVYKLSNNFLQYETSPTGYKIALVPSDSSDYGYNTAPFTYIKNVSIPKTGYYQPGSSKIYYSSGNSIYSYDITTNTNTFELSAAAERSFHQVIPYGGDFIALYGNTNIDYDTVDANLYYVQRQILSSPALLGEIIEDISTKAGISLDILDISDSAYNVEVGGYNISDDIKLIDALETLLIHYFIDAYESEWKIKFKTRKEAIDNIVTLEDLELGIKSLGEDNNEKYRITLREDTQLPQSVSYTYISSENGFSQANVIAIRNIDFNLGIKASIKAPIALLTNEAYNNAFRILFDMWRTTKEYEFRLPTKYSYIEPGDIVLLPINASDLTNEYLVIKISEIVAEGGKYLELKGVEEDARNFDGFLQTNGAFETSINTLLPLSYTKLTLLDTRPLYNKFSNITYTELGAGIYVGAYSNSTYWQGGSLFTSFDNQTFIRAQDFPIPGGTGGIIYSLTNTRINPKYLDTINSITVQVESYQDFFAPTEDDFYYREAGTIAIVSNSTGHVEYLQYKNVDIVDESNPKIVRFTNLLRGLYDSYNYDANFSFQDRVYYIPKGLKKIELSTEYYNTIFYTKGVSFNQAIDNITAEPRKYNCNWFLPYEIAQGEATYNGSDIVLSWNARERSKPLYLLFSPESTDPIEYSIKIYKNSQLIREDTSTSHSYTYTSANMLSDGITYLDILQFKIQRKALFLNYSHSIISTIDYIPVANTYDILNYLYPSITENLFIDFTEQDTVSMKLNDSKYMVVYNNYNGLGKLSTAPGYYSNSAKILTASDKLTYYNFVSTNSWTLYYIFKYTGNVSADGPIIYSGGSYGYYPFLSNYPNWEIIFQNTYCGAYQDYIVTPNIWYFAAFSAGDPTARTKRMYIRNLEDPTQLYQSSVSCTSGGQAPLSSTGYLFETTGTKGIVLQDLGMINVDLYAAGGNNYTGYDKLFNIGRNKWLKR